MNKRWQRLRSQAEALQVLLQGVAPAPRSSDLETALHQSLDSAGLQGRYQLQPQDAGSWRLTFEQAPADAVIDWLLVNPRPFSLEVSAAHLQRAGAATPSNSAGTLSGTVRMDQAPGAKEAS